jgi:ABC-type multidrug transport system permease subunit
VADNTAAPLNRTERILAYMIASIGGLSVLAIIVFIVASAAGVDTRVSPWPTIAVFPTFGLPVAFVLIIVFSVLSITRRRRDASN